METPVTTPQISDEQLKNLAQMAEAVIAKSPEASSVSLTWNLVVGLFWGVNGFITIGQQGPMGILWNMVGQPPLSGTVTVTVVSGGSSTNIAANGFVLIPSVNVGDQIYFSFSNTLTTPTQFLQLQWGF